MNHLCHRDLYKMHVKVWAKKSKGSRVKILSPIDYTHQITFDYKIETKNRISISTSDR